MSRPPINERRHLEDLLRHGPALLLPLDDDPLDVARTGVVRDLSGNGYHGAVSGTTYYNQVTVTGTLSPDATGVYTVAGVHNGLPYYRRGSDAYYIYRDAIFSRWRLTSSTPGNTTNSWRPNADTAISAEYSPISGATGTATVTSNTNSGIYRFDPAGVTPGVDGPALGGRVVRAAAFDGVAGRVTRAAVGNPAAGLSVSLWTRAENPAQVAQQVIFTNTVDASNRFSLAYGQGTIRTTYWDGATAYSASAAATTGWHHVFVSKAAGNDTPKIYYDGVLGDGTGASTIDATANTLWLGGRPNSTLFYNGSLAYATVIPAALTANDVYALYWGAIHN